MKAVVEIEWDAPEEQDWLCSYNIAIALNAYCPNTNFKVRDFKSAIEVIRFYSKLEMDEGGYKAEQWLKKMNY